MIRVILILLVLIVFLLVSALPLLIGEKCVWKNDENRQKEYALQVVKQVLRMVFRLTGSTLTVKGIENIPDMPVLYVGNHRSYFDIVTGYIVVPGQTGFIAKKEMEKIPLLREWMRNVNCLFLDRKDIKAGLKTILEGIEKVKGGSSIWIFPEGTRCKAKDPAELLPFKEGSLKIAEKSGCPVVPVATFRVWVPWPARLEQLMAFPQPSTWIEPVQVKVVFMFTTPSSRAVASVMGLKVEPGS